jgi:hypothetical protein
MIVAVTSESSPTKSDRAVAVKSTPHVTRGERDVSKELSKFPFVVAANHLAKPLLFLGSEDEGGHLRFAHFGTG